MTEVLSLLHLCDSLFPTGAFAHSDGLEAATDAGLVATVDDLGAWMDGCLDQSLACCDLPAVWFAWRALVDRDWRALDLLDAEIHALRPSAASRQASRSMGGRLVRTWRALHPNPVLDALSERGEIALTLPVAFGVVCAGSGISVRAALAGFVYTRLAAVASAAMRLMRVGQHEAHALLASRLDRAAAIVDRVAAGPSRPGGFTPAIDLAVMSHQYVHSRLFRS